MSGRSSSVSTNNISGELSNSNINNNVNNGTRLTRRLNVCISGTLANFFAEGAGAATWKPIDGKQVFMFSNNFEKADVHSAVNALKNAYILNCKVLEVKSSLPVPVGVMINCIPNNEITDTAEKYAFTALPMSYNPTPHTLYEAESSSLENNEWRQQYREYTAENLSTHNVLPVNGSPYVFVHESHPVIGLLRANENVLGTKVDESSKIDGEWFKVGKQVLETACNTLQSKVLNKINCQDLNQLQVQLKRLDAQEWTDHADVLSEYMDMDDQSIFDRPCSFHARLELCYELPH
jgi:hypothetical protein